MSASVELICVDPGRIHQVWDTASPLIQRAMERGGEGLFSQVEEDVLAGRSLLWLGWDGKEILGAGVTSLCKTDAGTICLIVAWAANDMRRCLPLLERIETYAKDESCIAVRIYGRKGWARMLPAYTQPRIILEKALT